MKKTKTPKNSAAAKLGSLGGLATAKRGAKHMSKIGKSGAKKRWTPKGKLSTGK
jgi:hypothetical protein